VQRIDKDKDGREKLPHRVLMVLLETFGASVNQSDITLTTPLICNVVAEYISDFDSQDLLELLIGTDYALLEKEGSEKDSKEVSKEEKIRIKYLTELRAVVVSEIEVRTEREKNFMLKLKMLDFLDKRGRVIPSTVF
jgi:hypothetical protein